MNVMDFPFVVLGLSFLVMVLSVWIGDWLRKRSNAVAEDQRDDMRTVLGATLTLLGLLLAFAFSMAINRYDQRKNFEEAEANAIGTEYVRADLLSPESAVRIHGILKKYIDARVSFYKTHNLEKLARIEADTADLHHQLWSAVLLDRANDTPISALVVSGMNDVLNSEAYTQAAWWNRIPVAAWALMAAIAIGCNLLIGYEASRTDGRMFLVIPVAVSIAFFLIADIDSTRKGAILIDPHNLIRLSQSLPPQ